MQHDELGKCLQRVREQQHEIENFQREKWEGINQELEKTLTFLMEKAFNQFEEKFKYQENLITSLRTEVGYLRELTESQRLMMSDNLEYLRELELQLTRQNINQQENQA